MVVMLRLITLPLLALMPAFALGSVLTDLDVRSTSGGEVELVLQFSGGVAELRGYRLNTPPRLALDLADTQSSLPQRRINVDSAGVERITALEGNGRTRLVVDLSEPLDYTSRIEGDQLRITLSPESTNAANDNSPAGMSSELETALGPQVTDIDFQRGADGAGRLLVSFDREGVVTQVREGSEGRVIAELRDVDIPDSLNQIYDVTDFATPITRITPRTGQRGADGAGRLLVSFDREGVVTQVREGSEGRVIAELRDVDIPDSLNQIYDVTDFATPITRITPRTGQRETLLELQTNGPYAMISSQSGRTLTVEVQPVSQASQQDRAQQGESFTGDRLSLNFQDIEVRAVLATLAEFTGLNLVASDSVTGRVTLNLNDVPWDQALALILQSQGLSSREQGNVIVVAPASELAEIERQEIEARSQQQILAPLVTEFIEIKYARAEDLAQLLRGGDGFGLLTERGRVSVDQRTNTLLIQDTAEQVRDIMRTLDRLDVAVRQVQIEARIVIARDSASRELGVNWGVSSTRGFLENEAGQFVPRNINPGGLNRAQGGLAVDLGSTTAADTGFSFGYLSGDILLDLELRALESEGKSQTISQPRVITANQRTATIRQGEERAFQSVDARSSPWRPQPCPRWPGGGLRLNDSG